MSRRSSAVKEPSPATASPSPGSTLPTPYTPKVAGYARGPFIEPELVTPSEWRWRGTQSYTVRGVDGHDYRCVRVHSVAGGHGSVFIGYWAVELLGVPLPLTEWE